jgi:AraC-like DNA-binding protein
MSSTRAIGSEPCPPFIIRRGPRRELAGTVIDVVGYRENGLALAGQVEMAALVVPLIISFGAPFNIALGRQPLPTETYGSFTSGLFAGPVIIDSSGEAECIQIDFTPAGACRFFGLPMNEIASRMVTLDELGDKEIAGLRQKLWEEQDWGARLDLAEVFVLERLRRAAPGDPAVLWAFEQIIAARGNLSIARLADRLEWSRKHLANRFQAKLGLPPKSIARMIRFHNAMDTARTEAGADWAEIAAACGYADQAHLTREFVEFSGTTPQRWRVAA